jgi:hypothetical protein
MLTRDVKLTLDGIIAQIFDRDNSTFFTARPFNMHAQVNRE